MSHSQSTTTRRKKQKSKKRRENAAKLAKKLGRKPSGKN